MVTRGCFDSPDVRHRTFQLVGLEEFLREVVYRKLLASCGTFVHGVAAIARDLVLVPVVMTTPRNNQPQENGYKVSLGDGSLVWPPAEGEIAARSAAVGAVADIQHGRPGTVLDEAIIDR